MRAPLTLIEQKVYHYLIDFLSDHTFQPSVREIARHFRIPSTKSVADLLASLERKGYVEREAGRSRGVELLGFAGGAGTVPVPVMGALESKIEPAPDDHVTLDRRLVPSDDAFLVRATREPAPAHGVRTGDLLLVHPSARAKDGDVVVVRLGREVIVGAMHRQGAAVSLDTPLGEDRGQLTADDDYAVLGVLAGVIRLQNRQVDGP
ncbi:MAG TPA: S24 family peptidase [Gemmatimonadaceae bacterium]|nr:S24 family peptidase [Gemmatimonadaceae bacterium]